MAAQALAAFVFGLISIVTPCVLPLVPGYLSAVSAVEVRRLGEPGLARRVLVGSVPIALGLAFVGLLPLPKQLVAPELVGSARRHGSFLLGAAFSICAAPCIGPTLAAALALAGNR